uniref:Branched-chain-amino-acid aminotransferase TOXF (EC) n=1 Tax=Ganoderma boninense TaxID=34458 RepID=A0A5K1K8Q6_9APHY|nr:Putative branched-chain-amino-acid aminotransferase TOXF (EC [Ganoderma boninense]
MKLAYDVLFLVLEQQSIEEHFQDVASLSRTCQTLRGEGVKCMLDRDITLRDEASTLSFALFMLSDGSRRRLPLLRRSLSIQTVSRLSHLERLALWNADQVLASDPRLPRAFASLTCLKHLDFHATQDSDNADCVYMFKTMQSRLLTASLHLPSPIRRYMNGHLNCELIDPIRLLRNSADTLVELHGCNFEARRHGVVYPHVRRLNIHLGLIPLIAPYMVSFPNVTSLEVTCGASFEPSTVPSFSFMNEDGQENITAWSALEELAGNLTDIFVLSLRCTATTLRVRASGRHRNLRYLTEVLTRARPSYLELEVESPSLRFGGENSLSTVFREAEAGEYIRTLATRVIETVEPLPLTSFKVQILHESLDLELGDSDVIRDLDPAPLPLPVQRAPREGGPCLLETKFRDWDAARHVESVRKACPSLKLLTVEGSGCSMVPWPLLMCHVGFSTRRMCFRASIIAECYEFSPQVDHDIMARSLLLDSCHHNLRWITPRLSVWTAQGVDMAPMSDKNSDIQAHFALTVYDVLLAIFDQLSPIMSASLSPLNARDLRTCALVCRAWAEPALCTLWSDLPTIFPLWHLLAPSDLPYPRTLSESESDYFASLIAARLHESPERWGQLLRYACWVRALVVGQSRSQLQLKLARTILDHNGGVSVFPSLKEVYWLADSRLDVTTYSSLLLTPELRTATFFSLTAATPGMDHVDFYDGKTTEGWPLTPGYGFLINLTSLSRHLTTLQVLSRQPITSVSPTIRDLSSFDRLRTLSLTCTVCHSILMLFAAKPCVESIQVSNAVPDAGSVAHCGRTRASSTLVHLDVSGDWLSLCQLFSMFDAPSLQKVTLTIHNTEKFMPSEYAACTAIFAQAVSSSALTKLTLNISGRAASQSDVAETMRFESLVALGPILEPLLALSNLRSFALSSPHVFLCVTDAALERASRSWPQLVDFALLVKVFSRPYHSGNGEPHLVLTSRALYFFWRYCPALRKLVLPQLDVTCVAPKDLPPIALSGNSSHALSELKVLMRVRDGDGASESEGHGGLDDGEARALAAYVHRLFPGLALHEGYHQLPTGSLSEQVTWCFPSAWMKVFACLGDS